MPDVFDFISSAQEVSAPQTPIDLPKIAPTLPTVPADNRLQEKTKSTSVLDVASARINALPDNRPAYSYTNEEDKRYSNPNLQFTPYTTTGTDIEDIYAKHQGAGEQLWHSLLKTGATTAGTFVSSFLTIPATLDLIRSGKYVEAFQDDSLFSDVQNWLTGLEDKLPNYYSEWERDHPYLSGISPTGAANFWGDKVIKNVGFTIGALGAGLVQDSAIELLSGGAATPATFIALAKQIGKVPSSLFRGFRNLTKAAQTVEGIDEVIGAAKASKNLYKGLTIPSLQQIGKGSRFAAISYLNSQGESFIEGYNTYLNTKKDLLQDYINNGEQFNPTILADIEKRAQDAGRWTTGLNLPLLSVSNMIEFPTLLYGKGALGKAIPFLETSLTKEGLAITSDYTFKKGLKEWAKETFKDALTEGGEESSQYFISNSMHDYYVDRLNPNVKGSLLNYTVKNANKILNDPQFYQEGFFGGLSGFLMGAPVSIPHLSGSKQRYDSLASNLNNSYQRFNSTVKQVSPAIELNNVQESEKHIAAHKNLYSLTHDSLRYGTFETFMDSLEDLKGVDSDSFNQTFGTNFANQTEQVGFINGLIKETQQIKNDIQNVEKFFPTNPFSKPFLFKKIQDAFTGKSQKEIENIQENLFDDFKEVVGYNQSLQRVTNGKSILHQDTLKTLGVKNEAISFLGTVANPKGLFQYSRWKNEQIKTLNDRLEYYKGLGPLDNATKDEKEKVEKDLRRLNKFYPTLDKLYQRLKAEPTNQEVKNLINALVLSEETSEDQFDRYKEEMQKQAEELQKTTKQEEVLKAEEKDLTSEESKTAEQLIKLNDEVNQTVEPEEKSPVPQVPENPTQWMDKYQSGETIYAQNRPLEIIGKDESGLIVKDSYGTYHVKKEGNKWTLEGRDSNLYHFATTENKIDLNSLEQDPVEEYLSEPQSLDNQLNDKSWLDQAFDNTRKHFEEQDKNSLKIGETFTAEQVFKTDNTAWIRNQDTLGSANFVYTKEGNWLVKRSLKDGEITNVTKGRWNSVDSLPNYLQDGFKQVLRGGEQNTINSNKKTETINIEDIEKRRKSFLGKKTSAEEKFNFMESLPIGTIFINGDNKITIPKKTLYKSGTEEYTIIPQIKNENGEWEDNIGGISLLSKKKDGTFFGELPTVMQDLSSTSLTTGERTITSPTIILPKSLSDKDEHIKSFMGNTYNDIELRNIFEIKINNKIFELNC